MKLLKLLARILPHSWFIALLASRVCRGIRIRLISRSFVYVEYDFICVKLTVAVRDVLGVGLGFKSINHIFKMSFMDAVLDYDAGCSLSGGWWDKGNPYREKYHNSLFFKQ